MAHEMGHRGAGAVAISTRPPLLSAQRPAGDLASRGGCRSAHSSDPHPICQNALLVSHDIRVNRCGLDVGVAQPSLDYVERNTCLRATHAKCMPQRLWHRRSFYNAPRAHDGLYAIPGRRAAPDPDT